MEIKGFEQTLEVAPVIESEKGEKIQQVYKEVGLYGYLKTAHLGTLCVTNFRLVWSDEESTCFSLHLSNILNTESQTGFLMSSPKLLLTIKTISSIQAVGLDWECEICQYNNQVPGKCVQCGVVSKITISCHACTFLNKSDSKICEMCNGPLEKATETLKVKFTFCGKSVSIQDVQAYIRRIIDIKAWESSSERVISNSMGVSGILKSLEDASKKRDKAVSNESFKDLESLMEKAGEMTKLAESLISKLTKMDSDLELGSEESASFKKDLIDFGIIQPVTKETSGNKYFQDLANELSNFLVPYSKKSGVNQYSLSDVFCLFNRARGIALVSPQDVYRASTQMKSLALPFELKTYTSGVNVLELMLLDGQESLLDRIVKLINEQETGLTASNIAASLNLSVIVAKEQLLVAETKSLVCRDDTINGLFFFSNLFIDDCI